MGQAEGHTQIAEMADQYGQRLDLSSEPPGEANRADRVQTGSRPFLGVHFACCDVYMRVYANRDHTAYVGRCPRCGGLVRFGIGPAGTSARFFRAE